MGAQVYRIIEVQKNGIWEPLFCGKVSVIYAPNLNFRDYVADRDYNHTNLGRRGLPEDISEETKKYLQPYLTDKGYCAWGFTHFTTDELDDIWLSREQVALQEFRAECQTGVLHEVNDKLDALLARKEYVPSEETYEPDINEFVNENIPYLVAQSCLRESSIAKGAVDAILEDYYGPIRIVEWYCS